jgi:RHS repeat-associated protein
VAEGATPSSWEYDLDRDLDLMTRADGGEIDYVRDAAGRLEATNLPDGRSITRTYSPTTGQLATLTGPDGVNLAFGRDGHLLTSTTWSGLLTAQLTRTYNTDFRLASETLNGGTPILFGYDHDGLLTTAGPSGGQLTITRDPENGRVVATSVGSVTDEYGYNAFGEVIDYEARFGATVLLAFHYERDDLGRITEKSETVEGETHVFGYFYDDAARLERVTKDGIETARYTYDANGNRLSKETPSGIETATYDDQYRLLTYGTKSYTWTADGELESIVDSATSETTLLQYDALGNLQRVDLPNGDVVEYVIDGENHRVLKKVNGAVERGWVYRDAMQPVAEIDAAGAPASYFAYAEGVNVPELALGPGSTRRLLKDHLGSPRLVVDVASGAVVQRLALDEFGVVTSDSAPGLQPFGFAGGLYEPAANLVRFGARDYDAGVGRWTGRDPILFAASGVNQYEYARSDPINLVDFNGLDPTHAECLAMADEEFDRCWNDCSSLWEKFCYLYLGEGSVEECQANCRMQYGWRLSACDLTLPPNPKRLPKPAPPPTHDVPCYGLECYALSR